MSSVFCSFFSGLFWFQLFFWFVSLQKLKQIAERRLSVQEDDGRSFALLAQVFKAEGDQKTAEEFYEKALDCDGENAEYLTALCELRLKLQ